jgi:hypothetical protein
MKRKALALTVILALLVSVLAGIVQAESSIPKPSVPEFSLKVVAHPYDVAPTTTIDPYTGDEIITSYGYREENKSVEVTIKNQPFTSTLDVSGNYTSLYYNVQFKGQYTDEWKNARAFYNASNSEYTVISISLIPYQIPDGSPLDFQVRAFIGYAVKKAYDSILPPEMQYYYEYIGQTGDWSNTQTITIPASTTSPTDSPPAQTPTPTPDQENQQTELLQTLFAVALIVAVVCVGLGLLIYLIKRH